MLANSEHALFEDRRRDFPVPGGALPPEEAPACPTASEVFGEIAATLTGFLTLAVAVNLLLAAFGG